MEIEKFGNITLVKGDCMDFMAGLDDYCYDLAIVDPPYGIDAGNNKREGTQTGKSLAPNKFYHNGNWDLKIPEKKYFDELFRVSKKQIIWGGNYFINYLYNTSCMIVWDKDNGSNRYSDCEIAWTSFNTGVRKFTWRWHGFLQQNNKNKQVRIHPTEKPIALYEWLLQNYAQPGWRIIDTHGGSMSHAIAAHKLGFDLTIIEKDAVYYEQAKKRLRDFQKQKTLF